jgi:hypothetical protein
MMNGNSANFDRRLAKLENSKLGVPANLAGFRPPKITVHNGEDADKIIKEMEARGEIPPAADFPPGHIRVIVHRIISPPNGEQNWERYILAGTDLSFLGVFLMNGLIDLLTEIAHSAIGLGLRLLAFNDADNLLCIRRL